MLTAFRNSQGSVRQLVLAIASADAFRYAEKETPGAAPREIFRSSAARCWQLWGAGSVAPWLPRLVTHGMPPPSNA
jgi:hypothetical protein